MGERSPDDSIFQSEKVFNERKEEAKMKLNLKRILAFAVALAMVATMVTLNAVAEDSSVILSEGFEGGAIPSGWTVEASENGLAWYVGTGDYHTSTGAHSGNYNAKAFHKKDGDTTWLITPSLDLTLDEGEVAILNFWYINRMWQGDLDQLEVYYRVGDGLWTELFISDGDTTQWTMYSEILPAGATTSNVQFAFVMVDGYGYGLALDDVSIIRTDGSEKVLSYNANSGSGEMSSQTVPCGSAAVAAQNGFTPPPGMRFNGWNTDADGEGEYYFPGDAITMFSDTVLYAQWIDSSVLKEGFECGKLPVGWSIEQEADSFKWSIGTGDNYSSTGAHSGEYNARVVSASYTSYTTWLISPEVDASEVVEAELDFWFINRIYSPDTDAFGVAYRINGGEWVELFSTEENHEEWTMVALPVPAEACVEGVQFGFFATQHYGYGVGLDDVELLASDIPFVKEDMFEVTLPDKINVSDGATDFASSVTVTVKDEYKDLVGTPVVTFYLGKTPSESAVLPGIYKAVVTFPDSEYYRGRTFTDPSWTFCLAYNGEFFENFDGEDPLEFWTLIDDDGDGYGWYLYDAENGGGKEHSAPNVLTSASYFSTALYPDNWAIMPPVLIPENGHISFWILAQDPSYPGDKVGVYIGDSPDVSSMTKLEDYIADDRYLADELDLSAYAGKVKFIAFRHYDCADFFRVNLDDVCISSHVHGDFTYVADDDTIIAYCGVEGCNLPEGIPMYLHTPDTANGEYEATLAGYDPDVIPDVPVFTYTGIDATEYGPSNEAPTEGGVYEVAVTLGDATVKANYTVVAPAVPFFKSHKLILSGQIGVKFVMDLSGLSAEEIEGSFMYFAVGDDEYLVDTTEAEINSDGNYEFTCYVNSLQMAEMIYADFYYGDDSDISDEYSVQEYIDYVEKYSDQFSEQTVDLVMAIADYGHYAQIYLTGLHNIPEGKYEEMGTYYTDEFDFETIAELVDGYTLDLDKGNSGVEKAMMRLSLDSETALSVRFTLTEEALAAGTELEAFALTATDVYEAEAQEDGSYIIKIKGITALQLGDTIQISGDCGGIFTVDVAPLAFVRSVLNNAASGDDALNLAAALYNYYKYAYAYAYVD